jgi:hypothetical protein
MGNDTSEFYTPPVRETEPQVLLRDYDHKMIPYQLDFSGTLKPQLPGLAFSKLSQLLGLVELCCPATQELANFTSGV